MAIMKDKDGNDVEAFTVDEVAAREAKALEDYQKEHPDQSQALADAQAAAKKAQDDLAAATAAGGNDKDKNFAALRQSVKEANDNAEKVRTDSLAAIEAIKNAPTQEFKVELIDQLSGKDKELKEKIELKYKALSGMPETNKVEVRARMNEAFQLATGRTTATVFDGGFGSASHRGSGGMPEAGTTENDNSKAQRAVLGINDEQAKKYAPKEGQPGYQA